MTTLASSAHEDHEPARGPGDASPTQGRKIIHVDMDAFYAAIEQRDHRELRGRPIAVGGSSKRGVVMTASYEARPYGVRSAMPSVEAARRCSDLIFVPPRMKVYKQESRRIQTIFRKYTDLVEPLSLDEAYLDVTDPHEGPPSATLIARRIRAEIQEATGLTASAGVSSSKLVAKLASDANKPNGLCVVCPDEVRSFLAVCPIEAFHGVGPVTARRMRQLGVETGADLRALPENLLVRHFGRRGRSFYRMARGNDNRPVRPNRPRKSVGAEKTFPENLTSDEELKQRLAHLAGRVAERLSRRNLCGRTVTLKVKFSDFQVVTRQHTLAHTLHSHSMLRQVGEQLLRMLAPTGPVRLLGLSVSKLTGRNERLGRQLQFSFGS